MRSNLAVGLDTAKGLALGFNVPFLAIHHMQAHALTPRLVNAMKATVSGGAAVLQPAFPFLTILVSGGHTMLIDSAGLTDHAILAETGDIALGDCLDKAARAILPQHLLKAPYGKALEDFAFPESLLHEGRQVGAVGVQGHQGMDAIVGVVVGGDLLVEMERDALCFG
jgi:N6-L-threonylcarbamoyladenine synthase